MIAEELCLAIIFCIRYLRLQVFSLTLFSKIN